MHLPDARNGHLGFFSRSPRVAGHRGWRTRFPDNTLAGLVAAGAEVGAVEVDVRRTGDGRLILSHDPVVGGMRVAETAWDELRSLDLGDGHRPCTLAEALAALPGVAVDLEVKNLPHEPGYEPDHRVAVETAGMARPGDVVTGFNWAAMDAVRREVPSVPTGLLVGREEDFDGAVRWAAGAGHGSVAPERRILLGRPERVEACRAEGLAVVAWTVDDPAEARWLAEAGVDAIITDDPGAIRRALEEASG